MEVLRRLLTKPRAGAFFLLLLTQAQIEAAGLTLTVDVPKTAYVQWITNSSDPVTAVNGDLSNPLSPYTGGAMTQLTSPSAQGVYLAIMCNSLAGYDITLTGANATDATTANMTQAGSTAIAYTCTLAKVAGTFTGGTVASTAVDLTGATASGTTTHAAEADLPMDSSSPNVWDLGFSLPVINTVADGLIMSGTYTGSVTATITLK